VGIIATSIGNSAVYFIARRERIILPVSGELLDGFFVG
jgi:hypothetical protein